MSNELFFDILPFNPLIAPINYVQLPIDVDDLTRSLQEKLPDSEVKTHKGESKSFINVYIQTQKYGPRVVATFMENHSVFEVDAWPKRISRELIFWYRHYVPFRYLLFLTIPDNGFVTELTAETSVEDIDKMYPYPVSDD